MGDGREWLFFCENESFPDSKHDLTTSWCSFSEFENFSEFAIYCDDIEIIHGFCC